MAVVDDDAEIVDVLTRGLEQNGFKVKSFTNPLAVVDYLKDPTVPCCLVVSDARMPAISGFELARRVKAMRQDIKIVLISAFDINKDEIMKVMPNAAIDNFLTKPFQLSQLVEVLHSFD